MFFFKQKTAYEMRISDWSSDVCSSDLLDPAEDVPFAEVRRAAQDIRKRLAGVALDSFPLLTGGKGIHVVVPIVAGRGWEEVEAFAQIGRASCREGVCPYG